MPPEPFAAEVASDAELSTIERIARDAGEIALGHFRSLASMAVESKGHLDLVTRADQEVERFLIARLREAFPDDGIYGEEGGETPGGSGRVWVVDPIDGTFNFVRGGHDWAISIGLYAGRRPRVGVIHVPARNLTFTGGEASEALLNDVALAPLPALDLSQASTGIALHPSVSTDDCLEVMRFVRDELRISFRSCGSSTLSMVAVALGESDGYVALGDSTWDVMAGLPILARLGVSHTIDWDRTDMDAKLRFACGSEDFLERVRPLLERVGGLDPVVDPRR